MTDAGNSTRWQVLELLVTRWRRIERTASSDQGPYIYAVTKTGMDKLKI